MDRPAPVLFVSHGSPMFAVRPGQAGPVLARLGEALADVRAILLVSPHWMTRGGVGVGGASAPETWHDFGGFPQALNALRYPAPGDPVLATAVTEGLRADGWPAAIDPDRPLDHGAWVPLRYLRPAADRPVVQVSLPMGLDGPAAFRLGQSLGRWRSNGVAVIGSGSVTHNLGDFGRTNGVPAYVEPFRRWVREVVASSDMASLQDWQVRAPGAPRAHPTTEHVLPLLVAAGAAHVDGPSPGQWFDGGIDDQILAMDVVAWT